MMTHTQPVLLSISHVQTRVPLFLVGIFDLQELIMLNRGIGSFAAGLAAGLAATLTEGLARGLGSTSCRGLIRDGPVTTL